MITWHKFEDENPNECSILVSDMKRIEWFNYPQGWDCSWRQFVKLMTYKFTHWAYVNLPEQENLKPWIDLTQKFLDGAEKVQNDLMLEYLRQKEEK